MHFEEFPHIIKIIGLVKVDDGMGGAIEEVESLKFTRDAFVDTPSSNEVRQASKLDFNFDRYVYVNNNNGIDVHSDLIEYQDDKYKIVGELEDQGGQGLIWRFAIKKCR